MCNVALSSTAFSPHGGIECGYGDLHGGEMENAW